MEEKSMMETPGMTPEVTPVQQPEQKKNNTPLIIAVVVILVLCCCCILLIGGYALWVNGDQLINRGSSLLLGML